MGVVHGLVIECFAEPMTSGISFGSFINGLWWLCFKVLRNGALGNGLRPWPACATHVVQQNTKWISGRDITIPLKAPLSVPLKVPLRVPLKVPLHVTLKVPLKVTLVAVLTVYPRPHLQPFRTPVPSKAVFPHTPSRHVKGLLKLRGLVKSLPEIDMF